MIEDWPMLWPVRTATLAELREMFPTVEVREMTELTYGDLFPRLVFNEEKAMKNDGPKVTKDDIEANIAYEAYFTAADAINALGEHDQEHGGPRTIKEEGEWEAASETLDLITICILVLRNGFKIIGHSACVDPAAFNAEEGRKWARAQAVEQVWPLMGYALRERLTPGSGPS